MAVLEVQLLHLSTNNRNPGSRRKIDTELQNVRTPHQYLLLIHEMTTWRDASDRMRIANAQSQRSGEKRKKSDGNTKIASTTIRFPNRRFLWRSKNLEALVAMQAHKARQTADTMQLDQPHLHLCRIRMEHNRPVHCRLGTCKHLVRLQLRPARMEQAHKRSPLPTDQVLTVRSSLDQVQAQRPMARHRLRESLLVQETVRRHNQAVGRMSSLSMLRPSNRQASRQLTLSRRQRWPSRRKIRTRRRRKKFE